MERWSDGFNGEVWLLTLTPLPKLDKTIWHTKKNNLIFDKELPGML